MCASQADREDNAGTPQRAMEAMEAVKRLLESARDGPLDEFKLAELSFPASELAAVKEGRGRNALHMASIGGKADICSYLVKERDFDINTFDEQGAHSCIHRARLLMQRSVLISSGFAGSTPLKSALAIKELATAHELLSLGADARCARGSDPTPVFYAAATGAPQASAEAWDDTEGCKSTSGGSLRVVIAQSKLRRTSTDPLECRRCGVPASCA